MPVDFEFEVGASYQNMKGVFEVVSIQRNRMVIRWADGVELTTSVDLQKRIIERMSYEEQALQQARDKIQAKKKKRKQKTKT